MADALDSGRTPTPSAPTVSDFICDVELGARKSLTVSEMVYFDSYLQSGRIVITEQGEALFDKDTREFCKTQDFQVLARLGEIHEAVKAKLGAYFIQSGIYPLSKYLKPTGSTG